MDKKLLARTFKTTICATVYIYVISQVLLNGAVLFNGVQQIVGSFVILLLFVLSAAIVGSLVLGDSIILISKGKTKEGVTSAIYSVGWLCAYTLISLILLSVTR